MKIKGKPTGFSIIRLGSTLIQLKDGYYLEIKAVPKKVLRKEGKFDPEGNPNYIVNCQMIVTVWSAEQIKMLEE